MQPLQRGGVLTPLVLTWLRGSQLRIALLHTPDKKGDKYDYSLVFRFLPLESSSRELHFISPDEAVAATKKA